jgi:geranylgeranyl pyrophosphate synthase
LRVVVQWEHASMSIEKADRLVESLRALTREEIEGLPPGERRRLLEALQEALLTARSAMGVISELNDGRGRQ